MNDRILFLQKKKQLGEKIVSLTAYDYHTARLEQQAGVDFILVGDSMAMVVFGERNTLAADIHVMIAHTAAVARGAPDTLVVGDLPYGSYEGSDEQAVAAAQLFVDKGRAGAVKLEGGDPERVCRVRAIIDSGIPVMGHAGLLPQSVKKTGGYKIVYDDRRDQLFREAMALQDAGVFAIVLEGVQEDLARDLTRELSVPTIGIGAGRYTDGQILVVNDMLGLSGDFSPRFLKKYAALDTVIGGALDEYCRDVRNGSFPSLNHVYLSREED